MKAWPERMISSAQSFGLSSSTFTFDSSTDKVVLYQGTSPINSDSIDVIYFRLGTVAAGGGATLDVRVETVVNGRPSGTLVNAGANVNVVVADTDDNTWKTATLGTAASLSYAQEFAIIIVWVSGATPNIQFRLVDGVKGLGGHYPLVLQDATGTWISPGTISGVEAIVHATTAGILSLPSLIPVDGSGTITNIASGVEHALKFTLPFKTRCVGLSPALFNIAAGGDFTISLWPSSSSVDGDALMQVALDGDNAISTTTDGYVTVFDTPVTLTATSTYYLGVRADTANTVGIGSLAVPSGIADAMRGFPIDALTVYLSTRTWTAGTAGAWTDTTTSLFIGSIIIDQLDDGAGGGTTIAGTPMLRGMI